MVSDSKLTTNYSYLACECGLEVRNKEPNKPQVAIAI